MPTSSPTLSSRTFPQGDGENARMIRRRDWSATPFGPLSEWPQELRISVQNALNDPFPTAIAWGPDLRQIYNDPYTALLADKHPRVFGAPARVIWAEVWDQVRPICQGVLQTGEPYWQEDARFLLQREEGLRESFFTFSYSPIYDEREGIAGLKVTAAETSASVLTRRRLAALQHLAADLTSAEQPLDVFQRAADALTQHYADIPLILVYLGDDDGHASLIASAGAQRPDQFPRRLPLSAALDQGAPPDLAHLPCLVLPIEPSTSTARDPLGFFVLGVSPVLPLDEEYEHFLREVARTITSHYTTLQSRQEHAELLRRRLEHQHLLERSRLLESLDDPFYAMDREWRITYVNPAARRDPAWPGQDTLGQTLWEVFPALQETEVPAIFDRARETGEAQTVEALYAPVDLHYRARIFPSDKGYSVIFRDITAQKEFERDLVAARERAEEMARIKSSLLANMSHEVRTPLTSIIGMATMLSRRVPAELQDQAEHIERAGKRLARTLDAVLTLARLEGSGPAQSSLEAVSITAEARDAVQTFKPMALEKGLSLDLIAPEPVRVLANALFLQSILNNLIGNAIKFTPRGFVLLRLHADSERAILEVSDSGIGIEPRFLPHIFEAFRQGSTGLSRTHGGVGLGLHITWKMVQACGGQITILTTPGAGTTFTLTLPLAT